MIQLFNVAKGAFSTSSVNTMITDLVGDIGDILASGLTTILGLLAVLIGLFFVLKFVWKKIGRGK
jgi:hypothetical protein